MRILSTLGMLLLVVAGSAQYAVVHQTVTTTTTIYAGNVQTTYYQPYNTVPSAFSHSDSFCRTQYNPAPVLHTQIHPGIGSVCTNAADFGSILHEISRQHFDSNRLQVAKQIIGTNRLTSSQITEIMRAFSFESSRLEIAKFAYNYVVDPHRYFLVNSAFSFSSSVDELNRFIGQIW